MHPATLPFEAWTELPDHTQLPDRDGSIVVNFQEHPQSNLLTDCLLPRLRELHPDGQFAVGCDVGIYWRFTPPAVLEGCKAPDWFYVPGVPPMLDGKRRRSYVLWREGLKPQLVIEYVSGDGSEEHDATPYTGKFWVYEQGICAPYYAIFDAEKVALEVYRLEGGRYRQLTANAAGRFPFKPLRVELGLWEGTYRGITGPWLRVWDGDTGKLMPLSEERAETAEALIDESRERLEEETERAESERKRADEAEGQVVEEKRRVEDEKKRADEEKRRADGADQRLQQLAEKLRALGIDPEG